VFARGRGQPVVVGDEVEVVVDRQRGRQVDGVERS